SEKDWVFSTPYFDILVYGDIHHTANVREWTKKYNKPYIMQESSDDTGQKWTYRDPLQRNHIRKYFWKFMMVKAQQMDLYMKGEGPPLTTNVLPGYPH